MPIRFSTEAANADHMGTDAEAGTQQGMPDVGADGTPRDRGDRSPQREPRSGAQGGPDKTGARKPRNDINAPGFVKDKDTDKP